MTDDNNEKGSSINIFLFKIALGLLLLYSLTVIVPVTIFRAPIPSKYNKNIASTSIPTPELDFEYTGVLRKVLLQHVESRCNDGSFPAIYYAIGKETDKWLIGLEGGGQCSDEASCKSRAEKSPYLITSNNTSDEIKLDGLYSPDPLKSKLSSWNKVYIKYCSSDGWHGDKVYHGGFGGSEMLHFQGARIVSDVFNFLMSGDSADMPVLSLEHTVLFTGFSAGGRGAMVNGDRIGGMGFSKLILMLDSCYYINTSFSWLVQQTKDVYSNFVRGSVHASLNNVNSWKDLFGQYRIPQVETRFFMIASLLDDYQVSIQHDFPFITHQLIQDLVMRNNMSAVFSAGTKDHATGGSAVFYANKMRYTLFNKFMEEFLTGSGIFYPRTFLQSVICESDECNPVNLT